jgi:hypothetical protein
MSTASPPSESTGVHTCRRCGRTWSIAEHHRGRTVRCPECDLPLAIPAPPGSELSAAANGADPAAGQRGAGFVGLWLPLVPALLAAVIAPLLGGKLAAAGGVIGLGAAGLGLAWWQRGGPALRAILALVLVVVCGGLASALAPWLEEYRQGGLGDQEQRLPRGRPRGPLLSSRPQEPDLVPIKSGETLFSLGELLAVAVDPEVGAALVLRPNGALEHFAYPKEADKPFVSRGKFRLQQPGLRAVLDGRSHRLFVAASDPKALRVNRYGDRPIGRGDLHIYDVRDLLAGDQEDTRLRPAAVIKLDADISHLLLAPDRDAVYLLVHGPQGDRVERLSAAEPAAARRTFKQEGLTALCLAPDGKTLYAAGTGGVVLLDPVTLAKRKDLPFEGPIVDVSVDSLERVFLAETGQKPQVTILNAANGKVIVRWDSRMHGRNYLAVMPDGGRLYLASSSLVICYLESLRVQRGLVLNPQPTAEADSDDGGPVRGEFFLTPDMRFLITRWGRIFQLAPPEGDRPPPRRRDGVSAV